MKIREAMNLAKSLKEKHGLHDWKIKLCNNKVAFGTCYTGKKLITLSRYLVKLNSVEEVHNTILHEIAHAIAGRGHGHDLLWRRMFISMGGNGKRCYHSSETITPKPNFIGTCSNGHVETRFRLKKRALQMACGKCCNEYNNGKFDNKHRFIWKKANGVYVDLNLRLLHALFGDKVVNKAIQEKIK